MSSTEGGEVVDVGARHAGDVGGDSRDLLQLRVPGTVDGLGRQLERGGGEVKESRSSGRREPAEVDCLVGQREQVGREEGARGKAPLSAGRQVGAEVGTVVQRQHGGEDPERVGVEIRRVDRSERR